MAFPRGFQPGRCVLSLRCLLALAFLAGTGFGYRGPGFSREAADSAGEAVVRHWEENFPGARVASNVGRFYCRGRGGKPPSRLCSGLVQTMGFSCRDYVTETQDGFTLGLQRISLPAPTTTAEGRHQGTQGSTVQVNSGESQPQWAAAPGTVHQGNSKHAIQRAARGLNSGSVNSAEGDARLSWAFGQARRVRGLVSAGLRAAARRLTWRKASSPGKAVGTREPARMEGAGTQRGRRMGAAALSVPVLVQHGLLVGAECWLLSDPRNSSLPFQLARAGFDTWLGNTRCSPWAADGDGEGGKGSWWGSWLWDTVWDLLPQPFNKKADWDWSWDEMSRYDVPALVEKVLEETGSEYLLYVGHSQGTLVLLSSLSMGWLPPQRIKAAYLLSPVAYLGQVTSEFVRRVAEINFDRMVEDTGLHHFSFHNELGQRIIGEVCSQRSVNCSSLVTAVTGPNCCIDLQRRSEEMLPWFSLSTSVKNMAHFAQAVRTGSWRMFDYGWLNIIVYGRPTPPVYDPTSIPPIPMAMAYGARDALSVVEDVELLRSQLKFTPKVLELDNYAHLDFILGNTGEDNNALYNDVLAFFEGNVGEGSA